MDSNSNENSLKIEIELDSRNKDPSNSSSESTSTDSSISEPPEQSSQTKLVENVSSVTPEPLGSSTSNSSATSDAEPNGADVGKSESKVDLESQKTTQLPKKKLSKRNIALFIEMILLVLSVMFVEMCIVPSLPSIYKQYAKNKEWVPWVLSAYNIVGAVWTPIAGALADMYGVKWIAVGSMVLYIGGQLGNALSKDVFVLLAFRGVQGFGMALFTLFFTAIRSTFPPKFVPIALGGVSVMFSAGSSIGLVGGAAILKGLSAAHTRWEYMFFITFPVVILLLIAFFFTIEETRTEAARAKGGKIDVYGTVLLAIGVVAILMGLTLSESRGWKDGVVLGLIFGGVVELICFGIGEWFIKYPVISMRMLLSKNFGFTSLVSFFMGCGLFSCMQLLPVMYQYELGKTDPLTTGLLLLPFGLIQLFVAPIVSILGKKLGYTNFLISGLACITIAGGIYIKFHATITQTILLNLLLGVGMGCSMVSMMTTLSEISKPEVFGQVSGTNTLFRVFGGAVGPVVIQILMYQGSVQETLPSGQVLSIPIDSGYKKCFIFITCIMACSTTCAVFVGNKDKFCKMRRAKKLAQEVAKQTESGSVPQTK